MKKLALILAVLTVFSLLFACGDGTPKDTDKATDPAAEQSTDPATEKETEKATEKVTEPEVTTADPSITEEPENTENPSGKTGEMFLVDLNYKGYSYNGSDSPFYKIIPHSGEVFEVNGVLFENGVFINPVGDSVPGYLEYDLSGLDYDRFACKVGKLDVSHGGGDAIIITVIVDGTVLATSAELWQYDDAELLNVEIPAGAQTLRIECATTGMHQSCSSVLGDARLYYMGSRLTWPE